MKIDKTTLNVTSHGFLFKAESTQDGGNSFEFAFQIVVGQSKYSLF